MEEGDEGGDGFKLDVVVAASGFGNKEQQILAEYMEEVQQDAGAVEDEEMEEESDEEEGSSESEGVDADGKTGDGPADSDGDNDNASQPRSASSRRSRAPSPTDSLVEHTASMHLTTPLDPSCDEERENGKSDDNDDNTSSKQHPVKERVASDLTKQRTRQARYHSKRSTRKAGRPTGSKAKQDTRVKLDSSGFWD